MKCCCEHVSQILVHPGLLGRHASSIYEVILVEAIVSCCAALDVHKDTVMACVREPGGDRGRAQQVREFRTFTAGLRALRE